MARGLQHEVAPSPVHPIEHDQMAGSLEPPQALRPPGIELDGAGRFRLPAVLRAVLAPGPRGADAADEIERSVETLRQRDRNLALTQPERVAGLNALAVLVDAHAVSVAWRRCVAKGRLFGEIRH